MTARHIIQFAIWEFLLKSISFLSARPINLRCESSEEYWKCKCTRMWGSGCCETKTKTKTINLNPKSKGEVKQGLLTLS